MINDIFISDKSNFSFGIPNLDDLIKFQEKSITVFYENEDCLVHKKLLSIFISHCLLIENKTFVLSTENNDYVYYNVQNNKKAENDNFIENDTQENKMIIAWRYSNLSIKQKKFFFNLKDKENLNNENILKNFEEFLIKLKNDKNCVFIIFSLFSPLYKINKEKIEIYLYEIKKYTQINNHKIIMSIPTFFYSCNFNIFFDNIISIQSDLCHPGEKSIYSAIFNFKKIGIKNDLVVNTLLTNKYGLRIRNTNVYLEQIDIPPEDAVKESNGCSKLF